MCCLARSKAPYATGEVTLAKAVIGALRKGMLCLADRNFFGFPLWEQASNTGPTCCGGSRPRRGCRANSALPDGSYLSRIYASEQDRRHQRNGQIGARDRVPPART